MSSEWHGRQGTERTVEQRAIRGLPNAAANYAVVTAASTVANDNRCRPESGLVLAAGQALRLERVA